MTKNRGYPGKDVAGMSYLFFVLGFGAGNLINYFIQTFNKRQGNIYSPSWLVVDVLSGLSLLAIYKGYGFNWTGIYFSLLALLAITAGIIDFQWQIIPNKLLVIGLVTGFLVELAGRPLPIVSVLLGFMVGGVILLALFIASGGRIGAGDVKYIALTGFFVGIDKIFPVLLISFLLGALVSLLLLVLRLKKFTDCIPFGPFISAAIYIILFAPLWAVIGQ